MHCMNCSGFFFLLNIELKYTHICWFSIGIFKRKSTLRRNFKNLNVRSLSANIIVFFSNIEWNKNSQIVNWIQVHDYIFNNFYWISIVYEWCFDTFIKSSSHINEIVGEILIFRARKYVIIVLYIMNIVLYL